MIGIFSYSIFSFRTTTTTIKKCYSTSNVRENLFFDNFHSRVKRSVCRTFINAFFNKGSFIYFMMCAKTMASAFSAYVLGELIFWVCLSSL